MFPYSEQTSAKIIKVLSVAGKLPEDIDQVKSKKISSVQYLEEIMAQGVVKEDVICDILAKGFSLRRTSLEFKDIDIKAFSAVPLSIIEEQNVLPFAVDGAFLKIAVVDPITIQSSANIKTKTSKNFDFYLITYSEFKALFDGLRAQHVDLKVAAGANSAAAFGAAKNNGVHNSQGGGNNESERKISD